MFDEREQKLLSGLPKRFQDFCIVPDGEGWGSIVKKDTANALKRILGILHKESGIKYQEDEDNIHEQVSRLKSRKYSIGETLLETVGRDQLSRQFVLDLVDFCAEISSSLSCTEWPRLTALALAKALQSGRSEERRIAKAAFEAVADMGASASGRKYEGEDFDKIFDASCKAAKRSGHTISGLLRWELEARLDRGGARITSLQSIQRDVQKALPLVMKVAAELTENDPNRYRCINAPLGEPSWGCTCGITTPLLAHALVLLGQDVRSLAILHTAEAAPPGYRKKGTFVMHMFVTAIAAKEGVLVIDPTYRQFIRTALPEVKMDTLQQAFPGEALIAPMGQLEKKLEALLQYSKVILESAHARDAIEMLDSVYQGIHTRLPYNGNFWARREAFVIEDAIKECPGDDAIKLREGGAKLEE